MAGYVYLIGSRRYSWYKIGKSSIPDIRIRDIGVLLPFSIQIWAIWRADNHHLLEAVLHEKYKDNSLNGEWFRFSDKKLEEIIFKDIPAETRVYPTENKITVFSAVKGVKAGNILTKDETDALRHQGIMNGIAKKLERGKPLTAFQQEYYEKALAKLSCISG